MRRAVHGRGADYAPCPGSWVRRLPDGVGGGRHVGADVGADGDQGAAGAARGAGGAQRRARIPCTVSV
jgi:hypothetical protein